MNLMNCQVYHEMGLPFALKDHENLSNNYTNNS